MVKMTRMVAKKEAETVSTVCTTESLHDETTAMYEKRDRAEGSSQMEARAA